MEKILKSINKFIELSSTLFQFCNMIFLVGHIVYFYTAQLQIIFLTQKLICTFDSKLKITKFETYFIFGKDNIGILHTRSVQKVSRIWCYYLCIHEYPFSNPRSTSIIFGVLVQLLLLCHIFNRSVAPPFHRPLQFQR